MGMSTHIKAFIEETDATFLKHKKVLLACHEANVSLPKETAEYFDCEYPELSVLEEKIEFSLKNGVHYKEYNKDMIDGYEVDLTKLPKEVTKIRFYNSY